MSFILLLALAGKCEISARSAFAGTGRRCHGVYGYRRYGSGRPGIRRNRDQKRCNTLVSKRTDPRHRLNSFVARKRADLLTMSHDITRQLITDSGQRANFCPRRSVEINLKCGRRGRALVDVNDLFDAR